MEVQAVAKYLKVQPRKVRIIAREVKGEPAIMSAHRLRFHPSKGAFMLRKVLLSAIANAENTHGVSAESLRIKLIQVDDGPKQKRITQKAMGRGARIEKKTSHITVVVEDYEPAAAVKPHGTQAKPRPKFEAPKKAKATKKEATPAEEAEVKTEEVIAEAQTTEAEAPAETTEEKKEN